MSKNEDALRCAEEYADAVASHRLESLYGTSKGYTLMMAKERDEAYEALKKAVVKLRAENEAKDALLRQAVDALKTGQIRAVSEWEVRDLTPKIVREAIEAIRQHLEGKA